MEKTLLKLLVIAHSAVIILLLVTLIKMTMLDLERLGTTPLIIL